MDTLGSVDGRLPRRRKAGGRPPVAKVDGVALLEARRVRDAVDLGPTAQVFAALGNVVRLQVVQALSEQGPMTVAELRVALSAGDINSHLRVLVDAGLIERVGHRKASGAPTVFALVDDVLGAISSLLR